MNMCIRCHRPMLIDADIWGTYWHCILCGIYLDFGPIPVLPRWEERAPSPHEVRKTYARRQPYFADGSPE